MGALKTALTAIFNANNYNSSSSGIASKNIPVTESSGLPSGQISMDNLAKVLGIGKGSLTSSDDLNDKTPGVLICNASRDGTPQNWPSGVTGSNLIYICLFGGSGSSWGIQLCFSANGSSAYRMVFSSTFGQWNTITST